MGGKPVHVTLLIGEKQKRLELALVREIHQHANQVRLIEVGASGRNALDLVLAAHLGRATVEHPGADFSIVSQDKDFDPLIAHLRANGMRVTRQPDFSALPFLAGSTPAAALPAASPAAPRLASTRRRPASGSSRETPSPEGKLEKLVGRLKADAGPRPKRKDRLLHHINTSFGNRLSATEAASLAEDLVARGVVAIDGNGKVTYPKRG